MLTIKIIYCHFVAIIAFFVKSILYLLSRLVSIQTASNLDNTFNKGGKFPYQIEEKFNQAEGSIKKASSKLTGKYKNSGRRNCLKSSFKVKEVAEDAKSAVEGAIAGTLKTLSKRRRIIIIYRS